MLWIKITGELESRGQPTKTVLPGKWPLKWCVRTSMCVYGKCVSTSLLLCWWLTCVITGRGEQGTDRRGQQTCQQATEGLNETCVLNVPIVRRMRCQRMQWGCAEPD